MTATRKAVPDVNLQIDLRGANQQPDDPQVSEPVQDQTLGLDSSKTKLGTEKPRSFHGENKIHLIYKTLKATEEVIA